MSEELSNGAPFHPGGKYPSPVVRVLALGWRDGPTHGMLQCAPGGEVFKFDLLDELRAWPTEINDLRVFSLAPLPGPALQELTDALAVFSTPHWPVWVPTWVFPTPADQEAVDRLTDRVLQRASPPAWIVASVNLLRDIVAARAITAGDMASVTDWAAFLGLERGSAFIVKGGS
jgi:hypothetical protein